MKNIKAFSLKLLAFVLVIAIALSAASFAVYADDDNGTLDGENQQEADDNSTKDDGDNNAESQDDTSSFTFTQTADGYTISGVAEGVTLSGEVVFPSEFNGMSITAIGHYAFEDMDEITSVILPNSLTYIGVGAFEGCFNLIEVNFSGAMLSFVGANAFAGTAWYDNYEDSFVFAGEGYKYLIGYKGTDKKILIPVTVEYIGDGAFYDNKAIESVTIAKAVKYIGAEAFMYCSNLSEIVVNGIIDYCGRDAFTGTVWYDSFSSEFLFLGDLLLKYKGNKEIVVVPNTFTKIAEDAFKGCRGVRIVSVPSTITYIGANAFFIENDSINDKYAELYCFKGSYAEEYAMATGLFVAAYRHIPGDFDNDGKVETKDARSYLRYAVKLILLDADSPAVIAGDIDGDGKVTASDARTILRMAVKIESYTPNDMLLKPNTEFEILNAYSNALKYAARYEAGFTKRAYQEMTKFNLDLNSQLYLSSFKSELTSSKDAKDKKIEPNDGDNLAELYLCSLVDSTKIKSAKCVVDGNNYVINIVLNDELDSLATTSFTSRIFPVVGMEDFNKQLDSRWWYDWYGPVTYDLTYTNCSIKAVIEISTGNIKSIDMSMQYSITDIAGKLGGLKIKDGNGNTNGNALRTDKVFYSDFIY